MNFDEICRNLSKWMYCNDIFMFVQLRNGWYDRMNWIWWESLSQWLGNWDFLFFLVSECSWSRFNEDGAGAHLLFWWDQLVSTYFSHPFSLVFPQTWSELKKDYNRYIPNIIYIRIYIYTYYHNPPSHWPFPWVEGTRKFPGDFASTVDGSEILHHLGYVKTS